MVVNIAETPGGQLRDIFFNITTEENCPPDVGVCNGHPALKDVEVRRALAHATNKEQLIQVATLGTASPGLSLVTPAHGDYYDADLEDYAFDIEAANQLLDDAGYEDTDGDGIRECLSDQDCEDLTFRLSFPDDSDTAPREAEQLQDTWSQIGVQVQIQGYDADTLTSLVLPGLRLRRHHLELVHRHRRRRGLLGVATLQPRSRPASARAGTATRSTTHSSTPRRIELDRGAPASSRSTRCSGS